MKKLALILLAMLLAAVLLSGCKTQNAQLEGNYWYLTSYGNVDSPKDLLKDTEITLFFDGDEGFLNGSAGCNSYGADYEINGGGITVSDIASTEIYCTSPEGIMEQEAEFLSLLGDAETFEVDDTALTIFCSGGQELFFTTAR